MVPSGVALEGEGGGGFSRAVTGGWRAVAVGTVEVGKRLEDNGGRTEAVWAELTAIPRGGGGQRPPPPPPFSSSANQQAGHTKGTHGTHRVMRVGNSLLKFPGHHWTIRLRTSGFG